ncbi:GAF domain-containing protein [Kitasatospora arboriphila]
MHRAAAVCTAALKPHLAPLARPGESVRHPEGSAVARCLRTGRPVAAPVREGSWPGSAEQASPAAYRAAGLDSVLAVPLTARGRVLGVLSLARAASPRGPSPRTTRCWSATLRGGPPSGSTTPAATPVRRASPCSCSRRCSPSRATRTRTWSSPPATCPRAPARWWAATGTRRCGCRSGGPCW